MQTIRQIAANQNVQPPSLQKKLKRHDIGNFGIDDILPQPVIDFLTTGANGKLNGTVAPKIVDRPATATKPTKLGRKMDFLKVLQVLPLPMLGLAASYGVYFFASQFVPVPVAIVEACAFELTYIGLASMNGLSEKQRVYARRVSVLAVTVSVIYNTLAGAIHQEPTIITELPKVWFWLVAIVHGAPLAILAYFVSDLIFHQKR